jgi:5-oxoprolinase (ATP-hydrolysing) subunit B
VLSTILGDNSMHFYQLGERAACMAASGPVDLICQQRIWRLADQLRALETSIDVVPGMNNLTVIFDPDKTSGMDMLSLMEAKWKRVQGQKYASRTLEIPVRYGGDDGPDIAVVAAHAKMSPEELIAAHSSAQYVVFFLGFQPGFAYMGGLPDALATPRRADPRLKVPAGSVGIGGAQTGIYPSAGPGGWNLIGRTELSLFDPARPEPILLRPGDIVKFVPLSA